MYNNGEKFSEKPLISTPLTTKANEDGKRRPTQGRSNAGNGIANRKSSDITCLLPTCDFAPGLSCFILCILRLYTCYLCTLSRLHILCHDINFPSQLNTKFMNVKLLNPESILFLNYIQILMLIRLQILTINTDYSKNK